ncbi:MAG: Holliday junction branch migration protein RuvA [Bacteroidales bacterium]|nr:Holliday junction branch migration protein RuvA [Bacteroidales bacterium]
MITFIKGRLVEKNPAYIVVDTAGGVGYLVHISLNTYAKLPEAEAEVRLLTHFVVKEDAQTLYGFNDETERSLFRLLISVNGIGPNTAIIILSALSPSELAEAVASENVRLIQSVKGIGAKTAQRLVIDLKDKVGKLQISSDKISSSNNNNKNEALSALVSLGFGKNQVETVLDKIFRTEGSELTIEDLIKRALKLL